jgi:hypothetical protein
MNETKVYIVLLQRMDSSEPLEIMVTDVEKDAVAKLQSLDDMWVSSVEKKHPFRIDVPYKGSFAPTLVKEVRIEEMSISDYQQRQNPYDREMRDKGFSGWMGTNFNK